jgi:hypothetical protein
VAWRGLYSLAALRLTMLERSPILLKRASFSFSLFDLIF